MTFQGSQASSCTGWYTSLTTCNPAGNTQLFSLCMEARRCVMSSCLCPHSVTLYVGPEKRGKIHASNTSGCSQDAEKSHIFFIIVHVAPSVCFVMTHSDLLVIGSILQWACCYYFNYIYQRCGDFGLEPCVRLVLVNYSKCRETIASYEHSDHPLWLF